MIDAVETVYTTRDPDYGTMILGFFQETPLFAANLDTDITSPVETDAILLYDPPADMNGPDYIEGSIEATPGNITASSIDKTFTLVQTKGLSIAGIIQGIVNCTIDLDQVDGSQGGAARLDAILVELLRYRISDETTNQIGILTHTINKDIAGNVTTVTYAEQTISELFLFDAGVATPIEVGVTVGYLLQMRVKIDFSAHTKSEATTNTIAKCRLNCYRNKSKNTILRVPVI